MKNEKNYIFEKKAGGTAPRNNFTKFGAHWNIFRHRIKDTLVLQTRRLTFLSIVISVFRRYEKPTEKISAQSEKIRYGVWIPIYLPSSTSDV